MSLVKLQAVLNGGFELAFGEVVFKIFCVAMLAWLAASQFFPILKSPNAFAVFVLSVLGIWVFLVTCAFSLCVNERIKELERKIRAR